jgi:signal transduction histidine kinase
MIEETGFFVLYLFYGLVFFTIGSAIMSRDLRFSDLKVARVLWLLALFAYSHGLSEWLELFMRINSGHFPGEFYPYWLFAKLLLTGLSFVFLLCFGLRLFFLSKYTWPAWRVLSATGVLLALGLFLYIYFHNGRYPYELYLRNFVAFPGAVMAGFGFIRYSFTVEDLSRLGAKNLNHAGFAILLYGLFAGAFPSGITIVGIPIEIYRALAAFLMLHCIMRALRIFDVEKKAQIEESLKRFAQSEKLVALGKLSAGIAHEINNPLANVLMSVELLEKDLNKLLPFDNNCRPRIEVIKRNLDRAAKIAGELLFFSYNREAAFEPFNLNEVIHKTFQLLDNRQKDYVFSIDLGDVPEIDGIPWKVEEVLLNLLMNAMDATPEGGKIAVLTRVEGDHLCCTIQDQGSGIREEDLRYVFDPFFSTKEPGKGTGLGLSICFGIMEMHGGEIFINSKVREGTTIRLLFPLPERSRP